MSEARLLNYQEFRKSDLLNRLNSGIIPSGVYAGFDFDSSSTGTTLTLEHVTSGFYDVVMDTGGSPVEVGPFGLIVTPQGVKIRYANNLDLEVIPNGSASPRIDRIVCQHVNTPISGGADSGFIIITGTPTSTPVPPDVMFVTDTTVGFLYVDGNATGIEDMTYRKAHIPNFGNDTTVLHSDEDAHITASYTADHILSSAAPLSLISLGGGVYKLKSTVISNYYYVANVDTTPRKISQIDIPVSNGMSPVRIYTMQPLIFQIGGNIDLHDGASTQLLRVGEFIEFVNVKGYLGHSVPSYVMCRSGSLGNTGLAKMFTAFSEAKDAATIDTGAVSLPFANYCTLSIDFTTVQAASGGIRSISSHDYLWNGVDSPTKGGTRIFLELNNSGVGANLNVYSNYGGSITSGTKPLQFADGVDYTVRDGAVLVLLETETVYKVLEVIDSTTANYALYKAVTGTNTIMTNSEHKFTKVQAYGIANLGTVDISSGILLLPDTGNTFMLNVAPNGTIDNIKLVRGTGSPVTYPTGTEITLIISQSSFSTLTDTCSRFSLVSGYIDAAVNDSISAFPYTSSVADYLSIISKVYGDNTYTVFKMIKTSTTWFITEVNYDYGSLFRLTTAEVNLDTVTTNTTFSSWTTVTVFGSHWAAGSTSLRYRSVGTTNKVVYIEGNFARTSGIGGTAIFTLPVGLRPARSIYTPITYIESGTYYTAYVRVDSDGTVNYAGDVATSHDYWMNISFGI